jgi:hypothetical protein
MKNNWREEHIEIEDVDRSNCTYLIQVTETIMKYIRTTTSRDNSVKMVFHFKSQDPGISLL